MAKLQLNPSHVARLKTTIAKKLGTLPSRAPAALTSVAELWLTAMKNRTPVKTGALRSSGHVTPPVKRGKTVEVRIVFGNQSAWYAKPVHERLNVHHPVGQAKYVESVVLERRGSFKTEVVRFMR